MPAYPVAATCAATSRAACGGQIERITEDRSITRSNVTPVSSAASARPVDARDRPAGSQSTSCPTETRQPPTAAPLSPGCSSPTVAIGTSSAVSVVPSPLCRLTAPRNHPGSEPQPNRNLRPSKQAALPSVPRVTPECYFARAAVRPQHGGPPGVPPRVNVFVELSRTTHPPEIVGSRLRVAQQLTVFTVSKRPDRTVALFIIVGRDDIEHIKNRVSTGCAHELPVRLLHQLIDSCRGAETEFGRIQVAALVENTAAQAGQRLGHIALIRNHVFPV